MNQTNDNPNVSSFSINQQPGVPYAGCSSADAQQELPQRFLQALENDTLLEEIKELFLGMDKATWNVSAGQLLVEPRDLVQFGYLKQPHILSAQIVIVANKEDLLFNQSHTEQDSGSIHA